MLLRRHPSNEACYLLVVAARDDAGLSAAARHFAAMNLNLVDAERVVFAASAAPKRSDYRSGLQPRMRYKFDQLGFQRVEMKGVGESARLALKMPADLFAIKDVDVDLVLHFSYASGFGDDSMISILLNGVFQKSIPLDHPEGMLINDYRIRLPLRSFRRGANTITFQSHIVPRDASRDYGHVRDMMKFTLFEDSIVRIPDLSYYARLPNLSLLKQTGFPYAEAKQSQLSLAADDPRYIDAAMTLVAKLAQVQQRPVFELAMRYGAYNDRNESVLLLGAMADVDERVWRASPLTLKQDQLYVPVSEANRYEGVPYNTMTMVVGFERIVDAFARKMGRPVDMQRLDMSRYGVMSQFESPWQQGSSLTLLTAATPELLQQAVYRLVEGAVWRGIRGDTVVWGVRPEAGAGDEALSFKLADEYHVGSLSLLGKIAYYAITSPVYLLLLVVSLVLVLTWLTRRLVILHHESGAR